MPTSCEICKSAQRTEIERALIEMTDNKALTLEVIASQFNVPLEAITAHAMFHTPWVAASAGIPSDYTSAPTQTPISIPDANTCNPEVHQDTDELAPVNSADADADNAPTQHCDSLARMTKVREAQILEATTKDYMVTLAATGRRINKLMETSAIEGDDEDKQVRVARMLTKPMVDLYIGLGGEIRQTVKALAELNQMLNGPADKGNDGIIALAAAIRGSEQS